MNSPGRAKEIISKNIYLVLATVSEIGEPWNAPVFFAHDTFFNLYWGSYAGAQHSINIRANRRAYIVIFDPALPPGSGEGVYIQATVQELKDEKDIRDAHQLLSVRHIVPYWKVEQFFGEAPIRMYKAIPWKVWMNGEGSVNGHYVDTREEIRLV
ncbi:pyridoxamine 5'-phosphate oxidase family protein [Candidatus Kaiserbacteria bacterium]|nr:pyridoxamine 5'-phosphate oxidase family protein [Candidatus Kaiserbacteria bacterium]